MNKLEQLFLEQRRKLKITAHIEALAKKDAEWFIDLYKQTIDIAIDDDESKLNDGNKKNPLDDIYKLAVSLIRSFVVKKTSIPTLKKQIEDYFESFGDKENTSVNEKCIAELKFLFKHPDWQKKDDKEIDAYTRTLKWIYYRFSKQIKKDKDFPLEIIHEIYTKIKLSSRDINDVKPAYCKTICNNDDIDKKYNSPEYNFSDLANEPDDDVEGFISAIEGLMCEYPNLEKLYKPEEFANALKLLLNLGNSETEFMEVLKEASYIYFEVKNYRDSDKKWRKIEKKLFDISKRIWLEKGLSDSNFRQTKLRLLAKIKSNPNSNKAKDELMGFMTTDHLNDDKIQLDILNHFIPYFNNMMSPNSKINLKAYRFSNYEIKKMIELKSLFENTSLGDYRFTFERFPEVYYDTYDNYVEIYGEIGDEDEENTPDYLGVYCDFSIPGNDYETKEGVIVLFKDRIEEYSKVIEKKSKISLKTAEDAIRMVVLMHELGHWICHWPIALNDNWNLSYYNKAAQYKRTHEALANIITYWAVNKDKILSDVLEKLTPKIKTNPYYLYKNLIPQAQEEIIKKIVDLRKHFYLTDDLSYLYLEDNLTRVANHLQVFLMPRASANSEKISDYFFDSNKNKKIIELLDNKYEMDYRLFYENLILNTAKKNLDLPHKLYCLFKNEELNRKLHEINPKYNEDWAQAKAIICRYDIK